MKDENIQILKTSQFSTTRHGDESGANGILMSFVFFGKEGAQVIRNFVIIVILLILLYSTIYHNMRYVLER